MIGDPFVLGVNYWPRRKAMSWWSDFEADEVREEFAVIADLGMNMVRIFLLWEHWQPAPDVVAAKRLDDLGVVCDIAAELACTVAPGDPSTVWEWTAFGRPRTQFMASEDEFAGYLEAVLENLLVTGSTGAMLWCFADYVDELWGEPPCDEAIHERFFGLVRPDGSLKPHADVIRRFAARAPEVSEPRRPVSLDISHDEYYASPRQHVERSYQAWIGEFGT